MCSIEIARLCVKRVTGALAVGYALTSPFAWSVEELRWVRGIFAMCEYPKKCFSISFFDDRVLRGVPGRLSHESRAAQYETRKVLPEKRKRRHELQAFLFGTQRERAVLTAHAVRVGKHSTVPRCW